jgi:hypothetical protein
MATIGSFTLYILKDKIHNIYMYLQHKYNGGCRALLVARPAARRLNLPIKKHGRHARIQYAQKFGAK